MATKKSLIKKTATQPQQSQQDQELQEFFLWLDQQLGTKGDKNQLQKAIQAMSDEEKQQQYKAFQEEKQNTNAASFKSGGMLTHIKKLLEFKKGGKCKDCDDSKKDKLKLIDSKVKVGTGDIPKDKKFISKKK